MHTSQEMRDWTFPPRRVPLPIPTAITLTGTGVAETKLLTVTPTTLVFGPQVTGTTSLVQYITVTNTGNFTVAFTNVTITTN